MKILTDAERHLIQSGDALDIGLQLVRAAYMIAEGIDDRVVGDPLVAVLLLAREKLDTAKRMIEGGDAT